MPYQTIHHQMHSELYPTMPEAIVSEEMSTYDVDSNHVQVEKVIQKDGAVVKKILPILIKAEPDQEHITKESSIMTLYQPHLPPEVQPEQLLREEELHSYSEEATDDTEYLSDNKAQADETDSSAVESMVEELTKVDVHEFDEVDEASLKQAMQGYDNLRTLLPQLPVHEVPKLAETVLAIYTQLLPVPLTSMLTEMGPKEAIYSIIRNNVAEGTPVHQL